MNWLGNRDERKEGGREEIRIKGIKDGAQRIVDGQKWAHKARRGTAGKGALVLVTGEGRREEGGGRRQEAGDTRLSLMIRDVQEVYRTGTSAPSTVPHIQQHSRQEERMARHEYRVRQHLLAIISIWAARQSRVGRLAPTCREQGRTGLRNGVGVENGGDQQLGLLN